MKIGEVAEQTGLSISNIRFYEKKGLIQPKREQQSKYRDYSNEDVRQLKLILLYRKMNLPIETISGLIEGSVPAKDVLRLQLVHLCREQQKLQGSIDLCTKFVEDRGYDTPDMDIDAYLNYVKEEEKLGHSFAEVEELLEEFAEFTQFGRMIEANGLGLWLVQYPRLRRILTALWCMMFFLLPVAVLADRILDGEEITLPWLLFWLAWLLFFAVSLWQFWIAGKKNKQKMKDKM